MTKTIEQMIEDDMKAVFSGKPLDELTKPQLELRKLVTNSLLQKDKTMTKFETYQNRHRKTGRTTRLVNEAVRLAGEGKLVTIIVEQSEAIELHIRVHYPNANVVCESIIPWGFDWSIMRVNGSHPNRVWLVDHYIIERSDTFRAMYEALVQFNEPTCDICGKPATVFKRDAKEIPQETTSVYRRFEAGPDIQSYCNDCSIQ